MKTTLLLLVCTFGLSLAGRGQSSSDWPAPERPKPRPARPAPARPRPAPARPAPAKAPAPTAPPHDPNRVVPPLDGLWSGPLKVPGGQLELIFRFIKLSGGDYYASLDVPMQKVSRMAVTAVLRGDSVRLHAAEADSRFAGRLSADGKKMSGIWRQPGGFKAPLTLTFAPLPAAASPSRLTPPYREEDVVFSNTGAGLRLAGQLTVPAGPGPFPAVVLLSDAGPQDRDGRATRDDDYAPLGLLADYLTRRGIAVLRFDDRGTGKSTGNPVALLPVLVGDAQAALTYLRGRSELDPARLGLVGHGEGGNVALLAAALPQPPAFVVALAAAGLPGRDLAVQQQATTLKALGAAPAQVAASTQRQRDLLSAIRQNPDNGQAQNVVAKLLREQNAALDATEAQARALELTSARYRYFLDFDPAAQLAAVACPVLLLNGTADLTVDADANLAALGKGLKPNKSASARKLPGVNHLFQSDPAEWPLVNGRPKPEFSPLAQDAIREWVVGLGARKWGSGRLWGGGGGGAAGGGGGV